MINHSIKLKQASSPSDNIWLNRGVSKVDQCKRGVLVTLIIAVSSFLVMAFFMSEMGLQSYVTYTANPPDVNCLARYADNSYAEKLQLAATEYFEEKSDIKDDWIFDHMSHKISRTGALACFCREEY